MVHTLVPGSIPSGPRDALSLSEVSINPISSPHPQIDHSNCLLIGLYATIMPFSSIRLLLSAPESFGGILCSKTKDPDCFQGLQGSLTISLLSFSALPPPTPPTFFHTDIGLVWLFSYFPVAQIRHCPGHTTFHLLCLGYSLPLLIDAYSSPGSHFLRAHFSDLKFNIQFFFSKIK